MAFTYERSIHFRDTDAAGVVYFASSLSLCHEAYEEAIGAAGVSLKGTLDEGLLLPLSRAEADYKRPLTLGDRVRVTATPVRLSADSFAVDYVVVRLGTPEKVAVTARTTHVCVRPATRERAPLPAALAAWVDGKAGETRTV
jgi:1,4-dihydroxy-2-naphthoyl-CoA hydrolase